MAPDVYKQSFKQNYVCLLYTSLDTALAVTADTVAMSTPHEIDYTLTFDSATLTPAE